jgi:PhnB protein
MTTTSTMSGNDARSGVIVEERIAALRDRNLAMGGDIAFCHSLNRMRGTKTDGGQQDVWFRATLGLRKTGAGWQITHEHNSTPFYMDGSGRAATDLQPEASNA